MKPKKRYKNIKNIEKDKKLRKIMDNLEKIFSEAEMWRNDFLNSLTGNGEGKMPKNKIKWVAFQRPKKVKIVDASSKQMRKFAKMMVSIKNVKPVFAGQRSALDDEISSCVSVPESLGKIAESFRGTKPLAAKYEYSSVRHKKIARHADVH